jgi:hypothetical protein
MFILILLASYFFSLYETSTHVFTQHIKSCALCCITNYTELIIILFFFYRNFICIRNFSWLCVFFFFLLLLEFHQTNRVSYYQIWEWIPSSAPVHWREPKWTRVASWLAPVLWSIGGKPLPSNIGWSRCNVMCQMDTCRVLATSSALEHWR